MNEFRRLLGYTRPYRGRLAAALVAMVAYGAATGYIAKLIKDIVDDVLVRQSRVLEVTAVLVAVYLVKGVGAYLSAYWMTDVGQLVVRDVRNALFAHILGQSAGFFARRTTGQLLSRVTSDVTQIQQAVSETIGDLLRETIALVGYLSLLFWTDARLAARLPHERADHRLSAGPPGPEGAALDQAQPGAPRDVVARRH